MGVWTALILASQLLLKLCLHVEAQALGECYFEVFEFALSIIETSLKKKKFYLYYYYYFAKCVILIGDNRLQQLWLMVGMTQEKKNHKMKKILCLFKF